MGRDISLLYLCLFALHSLRYVLANVFSACCVCCSANLAQVFSEEEIAHLLLPRPGVIDSFVVEVRSLRT